MGLHIVLCRPYRGTCNRCVFACCIQSAWSRPQSPCVPIQLPAVNPLHAYNIGKRFKHGYTRRLLETPSMYAADTTFVTVRKIVSALHLPSKLLLTVTWRSNVHTVYMLGTYTVTLIVHPLPYSTKFPQTVRVQ